MTDHGQRSDHLSQHVAVIERESERKVGTFCLFLCFSLNESYDWARQITDNEYKTGRADDRRVGHFSDGIN